MSDFITECDGCGNTYDTLVNDHCPKCGADDDRDDDGGGPAPRLIADGGVVEQPTLVPANSQTDKVAYHVDPDCRHLKGVEAKNRSRRYIEFHELEPCDYCGGGQ